MLQTSARLLRLLSLFQAQRYWSGADLADRLEVTPRTLRRDVDRLRSLGYPVHSTSGTAGGYQLGAGTAVPPLQLDDEEAVAVAIALRTAAGGTVAGVEEASVRALAKLEQVIPERLRRRTAALHSAILPMAGHGPTVDARVLSTIAGACRDCESLRLTYSDRNGTATARAVEPHRLVHTGRRWYLVAWDTARGDWRTFRVDRIGAKLATGLRFTPRPAPDGDFAAYISRSIGYEPYPARARVILHAPVETASKWVPASAALIEPINATRCRVQIGASSLESLARWLGSLGIDFEIEDPPEFAQHIRRVTERLMRAATHCATP